MIKITTNKDTEVRTARRSEIVNKALSFEKKMKWVHQARSEEAADCAGFVLVVLRSLGIYDGDDLLGYGRVPDGQTLRDVLLQNTARERTIAEAEPGDIFLMHWTGQPAHVGFIGFNNTIIHCYAKSETVTVDDLEHRFWKEKMISVFVPNNIR